MITRKVFLFFFAASGAITASGMEFRITNSENYKADFAIYVGGKTQWHAYRLAPKEFRKVPLVRSHVQFKIVTRAPPSVQQDVFIDGKSYEIRRVKSGDKIRLKILEIDGS